MKVIITGASGLLGRALYDEFISESWDVLGLAYSRAKGDLIKVDLRDFATVKRIIYQFRPDVIIHSAAERFPDKVAKDYEACYALNVVCSKHLSEVSRHVNADFLYISTDYVFDGQNPPYKESDVPYPVNLYGQSKLDGEKAVMDANMGSLILRVPVMYGNEEYLGESAVSSLLTYLLKNNGPVFVSNYEVRYPALTSDVASICRQLVEKKLLIRNLNSIFHWCGEESLTKFEMIIILAKEYNLPHNLVAAVDEEQVESNCYRPKNAQLSCSRLQRLGIGEHTPFLEGIKCYEKFIERP